MGFGFSFDETLLVGIGFICKSIISVSLYHITALSF